MASYQRVAYEVAGCEYSSGESRQGWSNTSYGGASGGQKPVASYGNASGYGAAGGACESYGGQSQMYTTPGMQTMPARTTMSMKTEMYQAGGGGDPFCAMVPSSFPPGTDPKLVECFNRIDKDRSGLICDQELQSALSTFDQRFSLRTVHLLMYMFTGSNSKVIGPKEFVPLLRSLQTWKATFQMYDRTRNGRLDERELKEALMSMCFNVSPFVLRLLMSKFDKSGAKCGVEYDYFIECCVVVKGLTEKFKTKEDYCGSASFTYDEFLLSVLPFIVA
ncbi:hypothetical protein V2J09_017837 [Rumex salicifolius]